MQQAEIAIILQQRQDTGAAWLHCKHWKMVSSQMLEGFNLGHQTWNKAEKNPKFVSGTANLTNSHGPKKQAVSDLGTFDLFFLTSESGSQVWPAVLSSFAIHYVEGMNTCLDCNKVIGLDVTDSLQNGRTA